MESTNSSFVQLDVLLRHQNSSMKLDKIQTCIGPTNPCFRALKMEKHIKKEQQSSLQNEL